MAEPTSTAGGVGLAALAIALLGPMAGPYALIVFAGLAGAMLPLSGSVTPTRLSGAWLLLRCTLTAVVFTGILATLIEQRWDVPRMELLAPVAFIVGAIGDGWRTVFAALGAALGAAIQRRAADGGSPK